MAYNTLYIPLYPKKGFPAKTEMQGTEGCGRRQQEEVLSSS